jgi:hypothetical protein
MENPYWVYRGGQHIAIMQELDGVSGTVAAIWLRDDQPVAEVEAFQAALQELCDKANQ